MAGQNKAQVKARIDDDSAEVNSEQLEQVLLGLLAKKINIDAEQIKMDQKLTDLEMDSLDFVEVIFEIEEKYDVEIPYNANENLASEMTIGDFMEIALPTVLSAIEGKSNGEGGQIQTGPAVSDKKLAAVASSVGKSAKATSTTSKSSGARRKGVRGVVLKTLQNSKGMTRADVLKAMNADDKASKQSVSNALYALKKAGDITQDKETKKYQALGEAAS